MELLKTILRDDEDISKVNDEVIRLAIATYLTGQMIGNGGDKGLKVKAAFEYADLLMKG